MITTFFSVAPRYAGNKGVTCISTSAVAFVVPLGNHDLRRGATASIRSHLEFGTGSSCPVDS